MSSEQAMQVVCPQCSKVMMFKVKPGMLEVRISCISCGISIHVCCTQPTQHNQPALEAVGARNPIVPAGGAHNPNAAHRARESQQGHFGPSTGSAQRGPGHASTLRGNPPLNASAQHPRNVSVNQSSRLESLSFTPKAQVPVLSCFCHINSLLHVS